MSSEHPLRYVVIPDTQALYVAKDRHDEVNPSFVRFLDECRLHCSVKLVVPETVRGEILYQKVREILIAAKRLRDGLESLTALTGHGTETLPSDAELRAKVEVKFDKWLKSRDATVAPNVIDAKAWTKIIDDAIWRLPPFEHSDDGRHEKGFRDSLIKTSVLAVAKATKGECAFISDDSLLTQAIESEKLDNLKTFESLKLFVGHVSLLRASVDQKLAVALQANAEKKFYEEKNLNCLYFREKIDERIRKQYSTELMPAGLKGPGAMAKLNPVSPLATVKWTQVGQEKIWLRGTTFSGRPKPSVFEWKSRLLYTGLFQPSNGYLVPQLRKTLFEVTWTSQIKDSEITNPQLVEPIALIESTFTTPTPAEAKQYQFELPPAPQVTWASAFNTLLENIQEIQAQAAKNPQPK